MSRALVVLEQGQQIEVRFEDMMRYHGPGSPGGVAHAFKVLERALPLLAPDGCLERRELHIRTAFGGPGARDAFEFASRAVSDGRYELDPSLEHPERGLALARFVFALTYRTEAVTLRARKGYVTEEFVLLARKDQRTTEEETLLSRRKLEMAARVMAAPAPLVYELAPACR